MIAWSNLNCAVEWQAKNVTSFKTTVDALRLLVTNCDLLVILNFIFFLRQLIERCSCNIIATSFVFDERFDSSSIDDIIKLNEIRNVDKLCLDSCFRYLTHISCIEALR